MRSERESILLPGGGLRVILSIVMWLRKSSYFAWLGCAVVLAGCSREEPLNLVPVSGTVSVAGKPLTMGVVSLRPDGDNETLHHPTGTIDSAGKYQLQTVGRDGAPPGQYKVLVFADGNTATTSGKAVHPAMPKWLVNQRYTAVETTDLTLEIVDAPEPRSYNLSLKP